MSCIKRFFDKMHTLLDQYFPRVRQSRKKAKDKDWITDGIKRSIKQKHKLFNLQLTYSTTGNIEKWRKYRNLLNKTVRDTQ